ncbi:CCC motif membrane protein [Winogradskyella vidalii]|uniref:CCC motif membrane protein n=1 Tax=Winogradskyella vidalii TaxID=2615024 RepID=UPI0015CD6C08|nr:CCC motif membrane protein [Winogradskyella vidalii]
MEKQQIPNGTLILIMGILSIIGCCCYGIPGLIFGIVAIILAGKASKLYMEAPESYSGYGNVKAGKIMGIIGIVLSVLMVAYIIWIISFFGMETLQDEQLMQEKMQELLGQ